MDNQITRKMSLYNFQLQVTEALLLPKEMLKLTTHHAAVHCMSLKKVKNSIQKPKKVYKVLGVTKKIKK